MSKKVRLREQGVSPDPFIDATACRTYADAASKALERRLEGER